MKVPCPAKIDNAKKGTSTYITNAGFTRSTLPQSSKSFAVVSHKDSSLPRCDVTLSRIIAPPAPCNIDVSPVQSDGLSVSMDESMSTCDSLNSPEVEYIDNSDVAAVDSIERKASNKLHISENVETEGLQFLSDFFMLFWCLFWLEFC